MYTDIPFWLSIVFLIGGLAALAWSSDLFVDGAAVLAKALGISPFVIGMVIIGFGTSAPELCVSAMSGLHGHADLSLGNAYGSCIFNIAVILGVAVLIFPLVVRPAVSFVAGPALAVVSLLSMVILWDGACTRTEAFSLLALFVIVLPLYCWYDQKTKGSTASTEKEREEREGRPAKRQLLLPLVKLLVGLGVLIGSSHYLVWGAVDFAKFLGVSDLVIGLTIIAAGTSLPELASAIQSARRGEHEFVLGNIIGSNLFNTLAVVGLATAISPINHFSPYILTRDLPLMIALSLSIMIFGVNWHHPQWPGAIRRREAWIWLLVFVGYTVLMFYQETRGTKVDPQLRAASPFGHNMVLQRNMKVPVWGWASSGAEVTVEFGEQRKTAIADAKGAWRVDLDPMPATTESRTLMIGHCMFTNVVVGEVWLASGQSNMELPIWHEHPLRRELNGGLTLALAGDDDLRFTNVSNYERATSPTNEIDVVWHATTAASLKDAKFSAVAYHYAKTLRDQLKIPVGIVGIWWGGSSIRCWVPGGNIWNRQVAPLLPFAARGMIWYQGEADVGKKSSPQYDSWMRKLYDGWSQAFENPSLSFYFVQIPPFNYYGDHETLLELQRAQRRFVDSEKHAALTVITDVSDPTHIHPLEKEMVGRRLALHALKRDYGFKLEDESPRLKEWKVVGDQFVLTFDHLQEAHVYYYTGMWQAEGLREPDFEIAGEDGVWHPADVINRRLESESKSGVKYYEGRFTDGNVLKVRSAAVAKPKRLRYLHSKEGKRVFFNEMTLPCAAFEIGQ